MLLKSGGDVDVCCVCSIYQSHVVYLVGKDDTTNLLNGGIREVE